MVRPSRSAFTLIELLIVIAIIGVLMALLFPAFRAAINMARKTAAKNDVVQIANAIASYQTEYGQWPTNNPTETNVGVQGAFVLTLTGEAAGTNLNPRRINFLEVGDAKRGKSGKVAGASSAFVDPWGQTYQYEVDANYDNAVSNSIPGTAVLRKSVAVWSPGVPKTGSYTNSPGYQANTNTTNFIKSWD